MAASNCWLHSRSLSRAFLPSFSFRSSLLLTSLRSFRCQSIVRSNRVAPTFDFSSAMSKSGPHPVRTQARRSFSFKEQEEVASADDLRFDAPLRIVEYPDSILRAKNKRIGVFDENLKKLVDEMFDVMYKTDGIGLPAPQVGINVQLMVFNPVEESCEGQEIVLVNPKVDKYSKKLVPFDEGCLSFPGIYGDVVRPDSVKIDARDMTGTRFSVSLSGLPARVFQHEFDHLQGILYFDRMSDEVLDAIHDDLEALEKKYEERTGLPSPEKYKQGKGRKFFQDLGNLEEL